MNDLSHLVMNSSLGSELTTEEATILARTMASRVLGDGDFLITEGDNDDALHVLLDGKLEVVKRTGAGEEASLGVLREGDLAGELSFVDGHAHTVALRALCSTTLLSLTREDFEALVDENPRLVYKVMRSVARSAHKIMHRMNAEFIELSNYIFKQHGRY
ncbi:MAG TPA: cyclic nucleotide-binding domain-containing protein [Woeseiaceae bacterium]|nr:cyclic nucleotide-binding domain-containing protein [Woeseiaceae bacterium]